MAAGDVVVGVQGSTEQSWHVLPGALSSISDFLPQSKHAVSGVRSAGDSKCERGWSSVSLC